MDDKELMYVKKKMLEKGRVRKMSAMIFLSLGRVKKMYLKCGGEFGIKFAGHVRRDSYSVSFWSS